MGWQITTQVMLVFSCIWVWEQENAGILKDCLSDRKVRSPSPEKNRQVGKVINFHILSEPFQIWSPHSHCHSSQLVLQLWLDIFSYLVVYLRETFIYAQERLAFCKGNWVFLKQYHNGWGYLLLELGHSGDAGGWQRSWSDRGRSLSPSDK